MSTMDPARLLPPNSTPLERELLRLAPRAVLDGLSDMPAGIEHTMPTQFQAWLAAEWQLSQFTQYFDTTADLIAAGLPWLQLRGTAAAVKLALSWIDFQAAQLEEDGALLQIDPGNPYAPADLAAIVHLVSASIPAHVRLYRMYHGYDLRHFRLDCSRLDDGMLDDDSGVWVDGIKLSFGQRFGFALAAEPLPVNFSADRLYSVMVWDDDGWRLDGWRLDSEIMHDVAGHLTSQIMQGIGADPGADALWFCRTRCAAVTMAADIDDDGFQSARTVRVAAVIGNGQRGWNGGWNASWRESIAHKLMYLE